MNTITIQMEIGGQAYTTTMKLPSSSAGKERWQELSGVAVQAVQETLAQGISLIKGDKYEEEFLFYIKTC